MNLNLNLNRLFQKENSNSNSNLSGFFIRLFEKKNSNLRTPQKRDSCFINECKMARTQRPAINMNRQASCRLVREMLIEVNTEGEDMVAIRSKIVELLRLHNLKVDSARKHKNSNYLNGQRLVRFYERNPDKLPTVNILQPYETVMLGRPTNPTEVKSLYLQEGIEPPFKKRQIEIIDLTLDEE